MGPLQDCLRDVSNGWHQQRLPYQVYLSSYKADLLGLTKQAPATAATAGKPSDGGASASD